MVGGSGNSEKHLFVTKIVIIIHKKKKEFLPMRLSTFSITSNVFPVSVVISHNTPYGGWTHGETGAHFYFSIVLMGDPSFCIVHKGGEQYPRSIRKNRVPETFNMTPRHKETRTQISIIK